MIRPFEDAEAQGHEGRLRCRGGITRLIAGVPPNKEPAQLEEHHRPDEPDAQHGVDFEQIPCDEEQDEVGHDGHNQMCPAETFKTARGN